MASRFLTDSQTVWTTQVVGDGADSTPALALGQLFYASNVNGQGALHAVDIQQADVLWSWVDDSQGSAAQMTHRPVVGNGLVFAGTSQGLRAHDALTGTTAWTFSGKDNKQTPVTSAPAFGANMIVFAQSDGFYRALSPEGSLVWETKVVGTDFSAAAFSGSAVLFAVNATSPVTINLLYAVDPSSGKVLWTYSTGGTAILTDPAVGFLPSQSLGLAFIGCADGTMRAVNLSNGSEQWRFTTGAAVNSTPGFSNGAVYFGSDDTNFYAVDAASGSELWKLGASSSIVTGISIADGVAYFGTLSTGSTKPALIAVDLQSQGSDSVQFAAQTAVAFTATVENGVVYFFDGVPATGGNIIAVNLEDLLHEFFVESVLMVSTYDTSGTAPAPQSPTYRTSLKLFDSQQNARPAQVVKVWASGPMSITVSGDSFDIDTTTAAWVQSDATGELVIEATSTQLPMPSLSLWATFMDPEETVVVYPDQQSLQTLSSVQGSDLDPNNTTRPAVGYDGQPVLQAQFANDSSSRDAIASAIQNTLGTPSAQALRRGAPGDTSTTYLAFPQSMPNTVYVPSGGAQPRALSAGPISAWTLDYSNGVSFSSGSDAPRPRQLAAPLSVFTDIADFIQNVVQGTEQVVKTAWQWAEGVVNAVIHTLDNIYELVIQTLEDAVQVMVGFLKQVVLDLEHVFEWLSWVFDFNDIVTNAGVISGQLLGSLSSLKSWLNTTGKEDVQKLFSGLESAAQSAFQSMINNMAGSYQSTQQGQTNPQAAYGQGGAQSYSQSRWMLEKTQQNLSGVSTAALARLTQGGSSDPLVSAITDFITSVQKTVASNENFSNLWPQIQGGFSAMASLLTSGAQASQATLAQLLQGIEAVVELLIELGEAIAEALLKLLADLIGGLESLLTGPFPVPFINDIYKLLTGSDLRLIDLAAFVISVPATLVSKVVSGQGGSAATRSPRAADEVSFILLYAALFSGLIYAGFDAGSDLVDDAGAAWNTAGLVFSLIVWGVNVPASSTAVQDWLFWSMGLLPMALGAAAIKYSDGFFEETVVPLEMSAVGVATAVMAIVFASQWEDTFLGKDGLILAQNLAGAVPLIAKPGKLGDPVFWPILAVVDVIGDGAAAILDFLNLGGFFDA